MLKIQTLPNSVQKDFAFGTQHLTEIDSVQDKLFVSPNRHAFIGTMIPQCPTVNPMPNYTSSSAIRFRNDWTRQERHRQTKDRRTHPPDGRNQLPRIEEDIRTEKKPIPRLSEGGNRTRGVSSLFSLRPSREKRNRSWLMEEAADPGRLYATKKYKI